MFFKIIAPFYDRFMKWVNMDYSASIADFLAPVEGQELLDLGGGTGINAVPLVQAGSKVTVVDASEAMLTRAQAKGIKANFVRADASALPFSDYSFDIVLISDAWHHFRQQEKVIQEIIRLLRPGGRLYIIDFDRKKPRTKYLIVMERLLGEPSTFWTPEDLAEAFETRGVQGTYEYLTTNQFLYKGIKNGSDSL